MKLEEITKGALIAGIEPGKVARIVGVDQLGDNAVAVVYRTDDGRLGDRALFRSNESELAIATEGRPWSFDADGEGFKLAAEAIRINLAHLFDPMMAVHTSNVEPLPHQITAVYESMLPRQPLRSVLADDPGGSGTFYYAVLAIDDGGAWRATNALPLGDRIQPEKIQFTDGRFVYHFLERKPDEPMAAAPTVENSVPVRLDPATGRISAWG